MNRKGDLSLKTAPIVAINFNAIFSRKPLLRELATKSKLDRTFIKLIIFTIRALMSTLSA